jgi:hypothetical protein
MFLRGFEGVYEIEYYPNFFGSGIMPLDDTSTKGFLV